MYRTGVRLPDMRGSRVRIELWRDSFSGHAGLLLDSESRHALWCYLTDLELAVHEAMRNFDKQDS